MLARAFSHARLLSLAPQAAFHARARAKAAHHGDAGPDAGGVRDDRPAVDAAAAVAAAVAAAAARIAGGNAVDHECRRAEPTLARAKRDEVVAGLAVEDRADELPVVLQRVEDRVGVQRRTGER